MRNREPNSRPSSINASKPASDAVLGPVGRLVRCHFGHGDFQAGQQLQPWGYEKWYPQFNCPLSKLTFSMK